MLLSQTQSAVNRAVLSRSMTLNDSHDIQRCLENAVSLFCIRLCNDYYMHDIALNKQVIPE